MQKIFIVLAIFFVSCKSNQQKAQAQDALKTPVNNIKAYHDSISYFMDTLLNNPGFSGGILIAKNDTIIYEHYQGYSDISCQKKITDTTPFHVASTSKTFTSHAILQLVQQGKLSLSDTIQRFFPGFPYRGITIRHLLSHISGLPNYANFLPKYGWSKKRTVTNQDILKIIINKKPKLTKPIGQFEYCNTNYILLALIVEEVTGKDFPSYVKKYIFDPAGMNHTYILHSGNTSKYLPSFRSNKAFPFGYLDAVYGDKNVYTTCRDLMNYDAAIQNRILLDSITYEQAWKPQAFDGHYKHSDSIEYYGLGWRLKVWPNGNKIVYHNGWWHGNNAVFQRLFQDKVVIIITGNVYNTRIYHAAHAANYFRPYYPNTNMEEDTSGSVIASDFIPKETSSSSTNAESK